VTKRNSKHATPEDDGGASERAQAAKGQRARRGAVASVLLAVGALVAVNLVASRVPARVDLTGDHIYTLSASSRELVHALPDYLTVKAYVSKDLPPELATVSRYLRELLDEYRASSAGMLRFEVHDPAADPRSEEQATRCRIQKTALETRRAQKVEVGQYYLGLCLWYDGRSRALAPIDRGAGLEYQVSALIKAMSQPKRKVAFTAGHGERDLGDGYSFVKRGLEREVEIVTLDPSAGDIGDDVDALVVAGPRRAFDEPARRRIDAFVMKGKAALFLIDGMAVDPDRRSGKDRLRSGSPIDTGLDPLLAAYGFRIGRDFVFDRLNVPGPVDSPGGPLFANLPAFVGVRSSQMPDRDLAVLAGVEMMVFPFASSVDLVGPLAGGAPRDGRLWTLARSSRRAWRQTAPFDASPPTPGVPADAGAPEAGPFALAYAYQGTVPSAYPGGAAAPASRRPVRMLVIGDSDLVSDLYMELLRAFPIYAGGAQMLFNAIDWALEDDALTALRANVLKTRPIETDDPSGEAATKWGNVAGVPLAFCAAGILRWQWRRARRRRQRLGPA
jgi:ABC-type uncharacterized transport system involved in gliding motility auxiliary subunit